jgi:hypothetical protein
MAPIASTLRRVLILVLIGVAAGAAMSWRGRSATPTPAAPAQWPPLPERPATADAPEHRSAAVDVTAAQIWLPALDDGSAPAGHPIKVKVSSGIFHEPGGRFYDRTRPDRCYPTAAAAEADGYRRSKT